MQNEKLEGAVALVTGGAAGIGRATVQLLAGAGAAVAVVDRDRAGAERTVALVLESGGKAIPVPLDLADTSAIAPAVDGVVRELGRIDVLVNCAGILGAHSELFDITEEDWDAVQAINLKAPFLLLQHVARHMVERGGGGRIVNVSSSSAFRAMSTPAHYGSSKAGIVQLTRGAAAELGRYDINVNAVAPGFTATSMTASIPPEMQQKAVSEGPLANLLKRVSQPEDVAEAILFLCLPSSRQITGQTIHTSAGLIA